MNFAKLFSMTAVCLFVAGGALANDADFTLKNKTGYQIDEVYISLPSSKNWGNDIMGKGNLGDGEKVKITFPHGNDNCKFDIKVKYDDGDSSEWGGVDLCQYETITLYWDKKAQQTRAVGE
jgi:hypothetical protein